MSIKVSMKKPIYPKWVDNAIKKLSTDNKDQIVKCVIYSLMEPEDNGCVKIHKILGNLSNRVPVLPSIDNALAALMIAESVAAWQISKTSKDKIGYEDVK